MVKDYAKKYANFNYKPSKRKKGRYFWMIFGIVSLFVLSLVFFKLISVKKGVIDPTRLKLKKEIIATPDSIPKPREPKFDFYNILPQDTSSPQAMLSVQKAPVPNDMSLSIHTPLQKPLNAMLNTTPEQVAMAEAKKRLDQEVGQHDAYILVLGNFTNVVAAEQLQAQALLKGFPVKRKQRVINGKSMVQIFIGPLAESKINEEQKRLKSAGLVGIAVKVIP